MYPRLWDGERLSKYKHRLADALEAADPGNRWRDWRSADGHPHRVEAVRAHLTQAGKAWQDLSEEQREGYVLNLLAPLHPSQELLADLTATTAAMTATADSNGVGRTEAAADE